MAIWVNLARAAKFPEVMRVYKRAGFGQGMAGSPTQPYSGNPPNSAPRGFLETVRAAVSLANGAALPSWIRKSPLGSNDWQDVQVDVTAIPGVRALNQNGKSKQFVA
ncbi:MAG TPA: hypothetical protein VGU20_31080 [Stellaceae bacterium]|nr:hypothetical protein [Terriglobia bacterium]HEV2551795.1 hypothetical protein [Stellaceae bacterium]